MEPKVKKNLSYSGYQKYHTCPHMYNMHYNEKIRPEGTSSPLVFGTMLDKGLNEILEGRTVVDAEAVAYEVSKMLLTETVTVDSRDYDADLVTNDFKNELTHYLKLNGWTGDDVDVLAQGLFAKLKAGEELSKNQRGALMNLIRASMVEKCRLMFAAFQKEVAPLFEKITAVQKVVKRGIIDFEGKLKKDGRIVTVDNKSAARPYERDAIQWSVQLAGYGAETAMYAVFSKQIKKNRINTCVECGAVANGREQTCAVMVTGKPGKAKTPTRCGGSFSSIVRPEVSVQILIDDVTPHARALVEQAYADTEKLIEAQVFPKNLTACKDQFGKPCAYLNLCWFGDAKGLKKHE